jgi:hypothetical protein
MPVDSSVWIAYYTDTASERLLVDDLEERELDFARSAVQIDPELVRENRR